MTEKLGNSSEKPFSYQSTVLFVKDVEASKKFYTNIMGEEIEMDLGKNIGFKSGLAIWDGEYGRGVIFGNKTLKSDCYSSKDMLEIYYETTDMEKTFELIKSSGVQFVHEIIEQPWCQLTVRILDPDGHMIEIGERMDVCIKRLAKSGKTVEQIVKSTTMPAEIVNYLLNS
ncbi:MAG: VOC family protein [Methanomicrobium sp.]|nr:VOC family protein [Methanomicrobium sp.]